MSAPLAAIAACGGNAFTLGASNGDDASTADGGVIIVVDSGDGGVRAEDAGDARSADSTSGDGAGPGGKVVYVSASTGDDTRSGLDPMHPVKTIATGLAHAVADGSGTVEVCAGNYPETGLAITHDVALLGGFDCLHWTRAADYGFPTFSPANQVVVSNANATIQSATLVVGDTAVTPAATIDGLTITGATAHDGVTYGVDIQGAASPVLSNDAIAGGGGTATSGNWGSVGIRIGGTSNAELKQCLVGGGSGEAAIGSAGIVAQSTGAPSIHDDIVSGGTGTSTGATPDMGAAGIVVLSSLPPSVPLTGVVVTGADSNGIAGSTAGVIVSGAGVDATIQGCEIQGGKGTDAMSESVGVELETTGTVALTADRIYAGSRSGNGANTFAVHSGVAASVAIADSEIHAGAATGGGYAAGIYLEKGIASSTSIVFSTIYTGNSAGAVAMQLSAVSGAKVTDNLMVGGGTNAGNVALALSACTGIFASLDHNAFANLGQLGQCPGTPTSKVATDPSLLSLVVGSVSTTGDIELETSCSGSAQPWCVPSPSCPSPSATACASELFGATFTGSDDGVTGLFVGPAGADGGTTVGGWELAPGAPCAITGGGVAESTCPKDMFGLAHPPAPSIGAAQYASSTKCGT